MKMSSACSFIFMQIKVIFIRMVSHVDSLWNRGTKELGNGLLKFRHHSTLRWLPRRWSRNLKTITHVVVCCRLDTSYFRKSIYVKFSSFIKVNWPPLNNRRKFRRFQWFSAAMFVVREAQILCFHNGSVNSYETWWRVIDARKISQTLDSAKLIIYLASVTCQILDFFNWVVLGITFLWRDKIFNQSIYESSVTKSSEPSHQVYYLYIYFVAQNSIEVRFRNCANQFFIRIESKLTSYLDSSVRNIINT